MKPLNHICVQSLPRYQSTNENNVGTIVPYATEFTVINRNKNQMTIINRNKNQTSPHTRARDSGDGHEME